ncbi:MAG: hypothetical protein RLZZ241_1401 [Bacteroidota bacterium]|jgi:FdhD protein
MPSKKYNGKCFNRTGVRPVVDYLTVEEPLQLILNGAPFTMTMRTPGADDDLIRGLLHSEDVLNCKTYHPEITYQPHTKDFIITEAEFTIPESVLGLGYTNSRSMLSIASCGICGKTELTDFNLDKNPLPFRKGFNSRQILGMFKKMKGYQQDFMQSGGTHASAVFEESGNIIVVREDIGRHNAVDKVIGHLLRNALLEAAAVITVSGRISYEIVIKVFKAGIPILAAVSAPSSLAVDYAKELGITLLAFCREDRITCYSHPERILGKVIKY